MIGLNGIEIGNGMAEMKRTMGSCVARRTRDSWIGTTWIWLSPFRLHTEFDQ